MSKPKISVEQIMEAIESGEYAGFCLACGAQTDGVEPDALQSIEDTVRLCWYATHTANGYHIVLADEADQMTPAAQLALLSKLDSTDPAPNTIWIFTANDVERLEKRFLSRCRVLEFSSYGLRTPLAQLLAEVWKSETGKDGTLDWERIAKDANNNVRGALSALELELLAA